MRRPLLIGLLTFAVALAGLLVLRSTSALHPPYPRAQAVRAALRDAAVRQFLASEEWDESKTIALDETNWRVTFLDGARTIADVAVGPRGDVVATQLHGPNDHPAGATVVWQPAMLVMLAALFIASVSVLPLRSLRNLDALVVGAGFTLAPLALDARMVGVQAFIAAAVLAYVAARCAQVARRALTPHADLQSFTPQTPVLAATTTRRVLPGLTAAAALAVVAIVLTSTNPSDVAAANLAGATELTDGTIPYGHNLQAVHGDTYPLLSYVLFVPAALASPVRNAFDSLDAALWLNAVALLLAGAIAGRLGGRTWLLAWLVFPGVVLAASGGTNDVPAALVVLCALLALGRPMLSVALWAVAGGVKVVPGSVALADIARGRRPWVQLGAVFAVVAATVLPVAAAGAIDDAWRAMRFQFVRGSWFSVWQQLDARWLQVVVQAGVLGAAAAAFVALRARAPREGPELRLVAAAGGCLVALLQLSGNYWNYTYLPWLLPFVLAALFPPARPRSQPRARAAP